MKHFLAKILLKVLWYLSDDSAKKLDKLSVIYCDVPQDIADSEVQEYRFDYVITNRYKCLKWLHTKD